MDEMKAQFATTAAGVFGSGWAWLGCTSDGKLAITGTPNQGESVSGYSTVPIYTNYSGAAPSRNQCYVLHGAQHDHRTLKNSTKTYITSPTLCFLFELLKSPHPRPSLEREPCTKNLTVAFRLAFPCSRSYLHPPRSRSLPPKKYGTRYAPYLWTDRQPPNGRRSRHGYGAHPRP